MNSYYGYDDSSYELKHYGTPKHSGRYPYGSGERPFQGEHSAKYKKTLKKKFKVDKKIRKVLERDVVRAQNNLESSSKKEYKFNKNEYNLSKYKLESFVDNMKQEYGYKRVKKLKYKDLQTGQNEVIKVIKKLNGYRSPEKTEKKRTKDQEKYHKLIKKENKLDKKLQKIDYDNYYKNLFKY